MSEIYQWSGWQELNQARKEYRKPPQARLNALAPYVRQAIAVLGNPELPELPFTWTAARRRMKRDIDSNDKRMEGADRPDDGWKLVKLQLLTDMLEYCGPDNFARMFERLDIYVVDSAHARIAGIEPDNRSDLAHDYARKLWLGSEPSLNERKLGPAGNDLISNTTTAFLDGERVIGEPFNITMKLVAGEAANRKHIDPVRLRFPKESLF